MSSSLHKLIASQVSAAGHESISFDDLHQFLAPIVWEIESLVDDDAANLVYAVELALSEYSSKHLTDAELRDELRSLTAFEDVTTSTASRLRTYDPTWFSPVDNGHEIVFG